MGLGKKLILAISSMVILRGAILLLDVEGGLLVICITSHVFFIDKNNPLSAMVAIWHHIIVSFHVFGTGRVQWNLDFLGDMHQ
jgi:hypothetical protein